MTTQGLSAEQRSILDALMGNGGTAASMSSLAAVGSADTRNHCRSIRRLAARGLVARHHHQHDRAIGIRITAAGKKAWYETVGKSRWLPSTNTTAETGKPAGPPSPF